MDKKQKAVLAVDALEQEYPDAKCSLEYDPQKAYELLISTRLSAQCTDARVNIVTKELYKKYTSLQDFANAPLEEMEQMVKTCGLFKTKARDIIAMSKMLLDDYNGILPDTVEELTKLPGIGRKTANLIVGDIYHKPAVVCDTHCIRITNLLGLSQGTDPLKVEKQLREILPMERANDFCHPLHWERLKTPDPRKKLPPKQKSLPRNKRLLNKNQAKDKRDVPQRLCWVVPFAFFIDFSMVAALPFTG